MTDTPEQTPLIEQVRNLAYCEVISTLDEQELEAVLSKVAALEQERDEWKEMSRAPAKLNRDLLERESRLRAAIRKVRDTLEHEPEPISFSASRAIGLCDRALTKPEGES